MIFKQCGDGHHVQVGFSFVFGRVNIGHHSLFFPGILGDCPLILSHRKSMLLANYVTGFVPHYNPFVDCYCCDPSEGRVQQKTQELGEECIPLRPP